MEWLGCAGATSLKFQELGWKMRNTVQIMLQLLVVVEVTGET